MAQMQGGGSGSLKRRPPAAVRAPGGPTGTGGYKPKVGPSGIVAVPKTPPVAYGSAGGSGGSYGGYSGGGGGGLGSTSGGQITTSAAPKPPPRPPSLADFLQSDATYQQQVSALDKARADYLAQQNKSRTSYLADYTGDITKLGQNRKDALMSLEDDFASRGLIRSGLYADNMADVNKDFDTKQADLDKAKADFLAGLASSLANYDSEAAINRTKAKNDAAARRAAGFTI